MFPSCKLQSHAEDCAVLTDFYLLPGILVGCCFVTYETHWRR